MPPNRPRLSLADVMILIACTGLTLAIYMVVDRGLYGGQRFFFGLFRGGWRDLDTRRWIGRVGGALSILLIFFGMWTLVLPALPLRRHRPQWRRLSRQPGISACLAATIGIAFWAAIAGAALGLRARIEPGAALPPAFWQRPAVFDGLLVCAGACVAAVWAVQIVTGRWRPGANGFDRLGRGLGVMWLGVGATFAAKMFLD